ncbi:MAG: phosphoglycerate kinase [Candidatus Omnitrophica bacterium]|nr:phosphoglycerate kinase [Candidatus Omnitrophota bacterium]
MNKMTVRDIDLKGKKVIMRCDFNVPLDEARKITSDMRIKAAVPTIKYILEQKPAKLILMSHLGRPDGEVIEEDRLTPVGERLAQLLGEPVLKLDDCVGDIVKNSIAKCPGRVVLLENLRFHQGETKNDPGFAKQLAELADVYVNDAFGTAHRAHASTQGITRYLPSVAGFLLEKELQYLGEAVNNPTRPLVVILGGAKVSDKILLIENLLNKANSILIGGGMAYTFLKALGKNIGTSLLEADKVGVAKALIEKAKAKGVRLELSSDFVIVPDFDKPEQKRTVTEIPDGWMALDIGPQTIATFKEVLSTAKTVVWNGPLGVFEKEAYATGTLEIAKALAELTAKGVKTIIGGGDSASAVKKAKLSDKMTHISTGGGASLEFLEGKELPGVAALNDKKAG